MCRIASNGPTCNVSYASVANAIVDENASSTSCVNEVDSSSTSIGNISASQGNEGNTSVGGCNYW